MPILGIVPARKGSQRLPNKHHIPILGKPMFAYTLEAMRESVTIDRLVISTDDLSLKPLGDQYGFEFIERPAKLATSTAALDDAVRHACRYVKNHHGFVPDTVVVAQGNVPIRPKGLIDYSIDRLRQFPAATAFCTAREIRDRPEWAQSIVDPQSGKAAPFNTQPVSYRFQDLPALYAMDGAIHTVRVSTLFETEGLRAANAWFGTGLHLLVQEHPMYSLEIDFFDQIVLAEYYLLYNKYGDQLSHKLAEFAATWG